MASEIGVALSILIGLITTATIVNGQIYPLDCEKYCDKDCTRYLNKSGYAEEYISCLEANVQCDCGNGEETALIIVIIIACFFIGGICFCWCFGCIQYSHERKGKFGQQGEGLGYNGQSPRQVISTLPHFSPPGEPPVSLIQNHGVVIVDLPPPSYSDVVEERLQESVENFSYYKSSSSRPI